jgi:hypothetical protein
MFGKDSHLDGIMAIGRAASASEEMAFMVLNCTSLLHIPPSFPNPRRRSFVPDDYSASESTLMLLTSTGVMSRPQHQEESASLLC